MPTKKPLFEIDIHKCLDKLAKKIQKLIGGRHFFLTVYRVNDESTPVTVLTNDNSGAFVPLMKHLIKQYESGKFKESSSFDDDAQRIWDAHNTLTGKKDN